MTIPILGAITDGRISITIDSAKRFIEIRDNGIGIPVERVESVLLDIADSNKDGESSAGQFGIGRLVGGYFCKKLSFRTTYKGEEFASEIVFDIDKIKARMRAASAFMLPAMRLHAIRTFGRCRRFCGGSALWGRMRSLSTMRA